MQEDDTRRKTQRDQELAFATKKETEEKSATEESPESKKEIQRDDYMNESMAILADYINLQQKTE